MRPELADKVEEVLDYLAGAHDAYADQGGLCALVSWGKDSLAMLGLARQAGLAPPVVTFEEPYHRARHYHARRLQEECLLPVYTPPPIRTWVYERGEHFVLGASYNLGGGEMIDIPKDVVPWDSDDDEPPPFALCGLRDHYAQPTGSFDPPWGAALCGHKDEDEDPVLGKIPLHSRTLVHPPETMDLLFPLSGWSDRDVWEYLTEAGPDPDPARYDLRAQQPRGDKTWNTDYLPACVRCMRTPAGTTVPCPKLRGQPVEGCADTLRRMTTLERHYFSAENPEP